ncbi:MAG: tRNA guanosine(34) transglycosylase Tgt [Bradymonadales bacterium]|nr:tRNA guanosine(34) transglycosylase Tgt [Bradymonadales bacterium]
MKLEFEILAGDGKARCGRLKTARGTVSTPAFMPVGTLGTVKAMSPRELVEIGVQMLLSNTYHLYLRPGLEVLERHGGLHAMMGWKGPILTDSGGYQAYSLKPLPRITEEGVLFASHLDGSRHLFTPRKVVEIQAVIGSDIMMPIDDCPALPCSQERLIQAIERSTAWALESLEASRQVPGALFAIVQGGTSQTHRRRHLEALLPHPFEGFAVGGLAVGEQIEAMYDTVDFVGELLPADRVRYLMGVGTPENLLACIERGMDLFDCVLPTRNGRNGQLFTRRGVINLKNSRFREATDPIDPHCGCYTCRNFSLSYLRHLIVSREILGARLATTHNLAYYQDLMKEAREAIANDRFRQFASACREGWLAGIPVA